MKRNTRSSDRDNERRPEQRPVGRKTQISECPLRSDSMPRLKYKRSISGYSWAREFAVVSEDVDSTGRYKLPFWYSVIVGRRLESIVSIRPENIALGAGDSDKLTRLIGLHAQGCRGPLILSHMILRARTMKVNCGIVLVCLLSPCFGIRATPCGNRTDQNCTDKRASGGTRSPS